MSLTAAQREELNGLIDRLLADAIDGPARDRLSELICTSDEARRTYFDAMAIHAALVFRSSLQSLASIAAPLPESSRHASSAVAASHEPRAASPVLSLLSRASAMVRRPVVWSIGAAALVFACYAGILLWNLRDGQLRDGRLSNGTDDNFPSVATITGSDDAQWSPDRSPLSPGGRGAGGEGDDIAKGRPLAITSGFVELQLKQGTKMIIEGPAEWSINGANHATLKRGKLVAKVPRRAIGFTIVTPTADVVDLGTEFGVVADADGKTDIHVLRGSVEVKRSHTAATEKIRVVTLRAGGAVRVSAAQQAATIPFDGNQFVVALQSNSRANNTELANRKKSGNLRVGNSSFEGPKLVGMPWGGGTPTLWEGTGAIGMIDSANAVPTDGVQAVFLGTAPNLPARIYQRFIEPKPNTTYTMTADVVPRTDNLLVGSTGYLELWEGPPDEGTLLGANRTIVQPDLATGPQTYTVSGTTGKTIGGDLVIVLGYTGSGTQVIYDNVRVSLRPATAQELRALPIPEKAPPPKAKP